MLYYVLKSLGNILYGFVIIYHHEDHKQKKSSDKLSEE